MKTLLRNLLAVAILAGLSGGCASTSQGGGSASVETSQFGLMPDGRPVRLYTLRNGRDMSVKVSDFGATIVAINVPDRAGNITNVVLGADNLSVYLKGFPAAASTIGRVANRIHNARFVLDGKEIKVTPNTGKNHIHGGAKGFSQMLWESRVVASNGNRAAVKMTYRSRDGEEGYPGNCVTSITFTLTDDNALVLDYEATTDKPTVVNLTNHAYFNLAGSGDVLDQQLRILAERSTPADAELIPTGEIVPIAGTGLDFTTAHRIGDRINEYASTTHGYDHNFILNGKAGELQLAARAVDIRSGRAMECWTTQPAVQLYTGNHLAGVRLPNGTVLPRYPAFCLETQHYPDSPNHPNFPSITLRPGQPFRSTTKYRFSAQ